MPVHVVDKPLGPTSHDVVARARRLLKTRRVGHAGTLDPLATGVLLVLSGDATKLSTWLTGSDKTYLAWIAFGGATPTWDAEGPIVERGDTGSLDEDAIRNAFAPFLELSEQVPPRFSAIKTGGEAAYRAARRGDEEVTPLPARPAAYRGIELLGFGDRDALPGRFGPTLDGWRPDPAGRTFDLPPPLEPLPVALVSVEVAAGTYVRAFARDLGEALGVPAHLAGLVRTRVGTSRLEDAVPLDAIADRPGVAEADALPMPSVRLSTTDAARVRQGQRLPVGTVPGEGVVALLDPDGRLAAVADLDPSGMRLLRVWHVPASGDDPGDTATPAADDASAG
ncbi:MAG: tRNA pseudouridine(55) synthase TruB [Trueperaceae bacterium]|nr:tRNA pseudouridine(55) synthase TruB [Trueperaceae bacterium]